MLSSHNAQLSGNMIIIRAKGRSQDHQQIKCSKIVRALTLVLMAIPMWVSTPAGAVTLSDLKCKASQIPKRVKGVWSCGTDRTERWLVDSAGKAVAPVIGDTREFGRVQVIRTVIDSLGVPRKVRLQAGPMGFFNYRRYDIPVWFESSNCAGNMWVEKDQLSKSQTFASLGEEGFPLAPDDSRPQSQSVYLRSPGQTTFTNVLAASYAFATYVDQGTVDYRVVWVCHNATARIDGLKFDLIRQDMNSDLAFPLDVKVIP